MNYEKNDAETIIKFNGHKDKKNRISIKSASLVEEKNKIEIKDINFDQGFRIVKFDNIYLDYIDKNNKKNSIKVYKDKKKYILKGDYFNSDSLIQNILFSDTETNFLSKDFEIDLNIKKVRLDNEFQLENLEGNLYFKKNELVDGNLVGYFPNDKKMIFTVKTNNQSKITTFFIDHAKPIVKRYKFIKGFNEGLLDFNSLKKGIYQNPH